MTRRGGYGRIRHKRKRYKECTTYNTGNQLKPVSFVRDFVENLELNGENALQVVDVEKYTEIQRDIDPCPDLTLFNSSRNGINWANEDELNSLSNQVVHFSKDVPSECEVSSNSFDSEAFHQMTDEEALEYIQYLKQKIRKIKQILKTRSDLYPTTEQQGKSDLVVFANSKPERNVAKDDDGSTYSLSDDNRNAEKRRSRCFAQNKQQLPRWHRKTSSSKENRARRKKQSFYTLETMDGLDWSQFPISGNGVKKHLRRLYSTMIDDEFEYAMSLTSAKKKSKRRLNSSKRNSALQSFRRILSFLQKGTSKTYTFPAMNRHLRLAIHKFAEACGIRSKSHGREGQRSVTICRVSSWKFPQEDTIETILNEVGFEGGLKAKKNKKQKTKREVIFPMAIASTHSARGRKELERSLAVDIGEDNIGHRMLQSMGWSKGQSLGHPNREEAGLTQPVQVRIRPPRAGLGSA
ncbi:hypothetical protein Gasu2_00850 [Galdieria sulphuraria]|nr:hypothetical protein Gasu2_00850 [Galdieria sulphuraria]